MKTLKVLLFVFLSINIIIWLLTYFLNINLFSILRIESPEIEVAEPRYKLTTDFYDNQLGVSNQTFVLYDSECNRYGPFSSIEAAPLVNSEGFTTTCEKEIPNENEILINLHERRESGQTGIKNEITNLLYSFPGFEGDEETNLRIQLAIYQLPDIFRKILTSEVKVLNGCHPYGEALFNRCVYGVFDPAGYDADGNYGNEWAMTIWISDRGVESGKLKDILVHEAAHAYSYLVMRECILQDGSTFRELAHNRYGDEENLADVFVYYYGGKWTNYYKLEYLPEEDRKWMTDMIDYCGVYQDAVSALSISP